MDPADFIPVEQAAKRLGVSATTVRNMLDDGKLAGRRGDQPQRPRRYVAVNESGEPIDPTGRPVRRAEPMALPQDVLARLDRLEKLVSSSPRASGESYRDAALQLQAAMERQQRAFALQAEAIQELNAALAEQARIISGLLLADAEGLTLVSSAKEKP